MTDTGKGCLLTELGSLLHFHGEVMVFHPAYHTPVRTQLSLEWVWLCDIPSLLPGTWYHYCHYQKGRWQIKSLDTNNSAGTLRNSQFSPEETLWGHLQCVFLKEICLYFYYMYECVPACIYTYHIVCRCSQRPKDDVISGAVHGCELPCGCGNWTWILWKNRKCS